MARPAVHHHGLGEHRSRPDPEAVVAIFLPVDDELLERLAVSGDAEGRVFVSLGVAVATRVDFGHVVLHSDSYARFIHVIASCSTMAIETQTK